MRESKYRSKVVKLLQSVFAFPVENMSHDGCPDVCCILGWIEVKTAELPRRSETPVRLKHALRPSQRVWLRRWAAHGARAFTVTIVETDELRATWYLHDGAWSCEHLGEVPEHSLREGAIAVWSGGPSGDQLINAMVRRTQT